MIGRKIFMVFAVCIFHGCGSTSDSPTEAKVTSVTFVNKGSVSPNSSSTTVVLNAKSLEHLTSQAEQVTEKWVRRLKTADFIPMQNSASALFDAPDVTLRSGQTSCAGWQGMTIIIEKGADTHSLEISGEMCDRAKWPDGVRELLALQDALVTAAVCPTFTPPPPGWCSNGMVISQIEDANGCEGPPRCQSNASVCPEYSPPAPDWCSDGTVIAPVKDANGCFGPPSCQRSIGGM
jgi:hypothetical protein